MSLFIAYNGEFCPKRSPGRFEHVAAFTELTSHLQPEAVGVSEAGGYRADLRKVHGYKVIQPRGAAGRCALLIRDDVTVHDSGKVKLHGRRFVGRDVPGARKTGWTKARCIVWALITDPETGERCYVAVWHPVPGQSHSKRARKLLAEEADKAAAWLEGLHHPADLMGDTNGRPSLHVFDPLRKVASPAFAESFRGDPIDGHWIAGGTAKARALDGYPSDHKPVAAVVTWRTNKPAPKPHKEQPVNARIDAVDLSHWQSGSLDFRAAKKGGVNAIWHKATEGTGYTDPLFHRRRREVGAARIPFGAYHFADPKSSAKAQAQHFLTVADPKPGDLRPMLDFEDATFGHWSRAKRTDFVRDWVREVKAATGEPPVIYTRFDLNHHFDCPLWVARYSNAMSAPHVPEPWTAWSIWQFSNGQFGHPDSVPGLGHVDINTFNSGITLPMLVLGEKAQAAPQKPHHAAKPKPVDLPYHQQEMADQGVIVARNAAKHGHKRRASFFRSLVAKIRRGK